MSSPGAGASGAGSAGGSGGQDEAPAKKAKVTGSVLGWFAAKGSPGTKQRARRLSQGAEAQQADKKARLELEANAKARAAGRASLPWLLTWTGWLP